MHQNNSKIIEYTGFIIENLIFYVIYKYSFD